MVVDKISPPPRRKGGGSGKRKIILVGFMGTGKTAVGKLLAGGLGLPFTDLDEEIVKAAGLPVAEVFRTMGEPFFRRMEKELLARCCRGGRRVIAAGGGALCDPENLRLMRSSGVIVCLTAPLEVIAGRLGDDESRPLFTRTPGGGGPPFPDDTLRRLYEDRQACYRQADVTVDTAGKDPGAVAGEIAGLLADHGP